MPGVNGHAQNWQVRLGLDTGSKKQQTQQPDDNSTQSARSRRRQLGPEQARHADELALLVFCCCVECTCSTACTKQTRRLRPTISTGPSSKRIAPAATK